MLYQLSHVRVNGECSKPLSVLRTQGYKVPAQKLSFAKTKETRVLVVA
jgi:hypothetical protein